MLSRLFTKFDKECLNNDIYKIHTIGDCYVATGSFNLENRNYEQECVNVFNFSR